MSVLDELDQIDGANLAESKRALLSLDSTALAAVEECASLLGDVGERFGESCEYDRYHDQLNEWIASVPGSPQENVRLLEQATFIGEVKGSDPVQDAKDSFEKVQSVIARTYLLLRLRRDFLFGITDLLKLHLTPAIGYLRVQVESLSILHLIADKPRIAVDWLDTSSGDSGRAFYKKYHNKVVSKSKGLDLYDYYEQGSSWALHSRIFGVGLGVILGAKEKSPAEISLRYQEFDDAVLLLLWFCVYLRAHERMIRTLPRAVPEAELELEECRFFQMVEGLWNTLRPLYLKKRQEGLPKIFEAE